MSNKEIAIDLISRLPEGTSFTEMARRIDFLAGIEAAEEEVKRGDVVSVEEVRSMIDQWVPR
jgi:predicted transcriptional regulator